MSPARTDVNGSRPFHSEGDGDSFAVVIVLAYLTNSISLGRYIRNFPGVLTAFVTR